MNPCNLFEGKPSDKQVDRLIVSGRLSGVTSPVAFQGNLRPNKSIKIRIINYKML